MVRAGLDSGLRVGRPSRNTWSCPRIRSRAFGPSLIIGSYGAVALDITGIDRDGHITNASGLDLDPGHILTNAHVVRDTTVDTAIPSPTQQPPAIEGTKPDPISNSESKMPWSTKQQT